MWWGQPTWSRHLYADVLCTHNIYNNEFDFRYKCCLIFNLRGIYLGHDVCTLIVCLLDNCPSSIFCETCLGLEFYTFALICFSLLPPIFCSTSSWRFLATSVIFVVSFWVLSAWLTEWCAPGCVRGLGRSRTRPVCYCSLGETLVRFALWRLFACTFFVTVCMYSALVGLCLCAFLSISACDSQGFIDSR